MEFSKISKKWSDSHLFSTIWRFSRISRISKISRKWTFLKRPLFQKTPFSRTPKNWQYLAPPCSPPKISAPNLSNTPTCLRVLREKIWDVYQATMLSNILGGGGFSSGTARGRWKLMAEASFSAYFFAFLKGQNSMFYSHKRTTKIGRAFLVEKCTFAPKIKQKLPKMSAEIAPLLLEVPGKHYNVQLKIAYHRFSSIRGSESPPPTLYPQLIYILTGDPGDPNGTHQSFPKSIAIHMGGVLRYKIQEETYRDTSGSTDDISRSSELRAPKAVQPTLEAYYNTTSYYCAMLF